MHNFSEKMPTESLDLTYRKAIKHFQAGETKLAEASILLLILDAAAEGYSSHDAVKAFTDYLTPTP